MAPLDLEVSPRPSVDVALAARLAHELYGASGEMSELGSHQDRNFLIRTAGGPVVLKVANSSWGAAALEAQNAALRHVAAGAGFAAPEPVAAADGTDLHEVDVDGALMP